MNDWEVINIPFGPLVDHDFTEMDSFSKRGLNQPGVLLELENGRHYLIGHVNPYGAHDGQFAQDVLIKANTIVHKYKRIYHFRGA